MTSSEALIHLRVPAELKARWVRESRSAGMRLTDWITARVGHKGNEMACTEYTIRPTVLTADTRAAADACNREQSRPKAVHGKTAESGTCQSR